MKIISLKISHELKVRIQNFAEYSSTSPSAVIREAVEQYLSSKSKGVKGSFLEQAEDILGSIAGPEDLSVNKKYKKGYGR